MPTQKGIPIPWKARWPWFQVWMPLALLLYALLNGVGHMVTMYWVFDIGTDALLPLEWIFAFLCSSDALLTAPCLFILAVVSWKTCPDWSAAVRWASGMLGFFLLFLLLVVQGYLLQSPFGWPPKAMDWPKQKSMLIWIWMFHPGRPGFEPVPEEIELLKSRGYWREPEPVISPCKILSDQIDMEGPTLLPSRD